MTRPIVDPDWLTQPEDVLHGYSLEITAKDIPALKEAAPDIWTGAPIAVPFLANESHNARIEAAKAVRVLGFEPMPHFSARRIASQGEFESYLAAAVQEAGIERCFVVAGDPSTPLGPFSDSSSMIATGAFERSGIKVIGIGGHPEGHPVMSTEECWSVLASKCAEIEARGMAPLIVTQFAFDADAILGWLKELRARGLDHAVRVGVPGPAGIKTLARFAAMCGVGASTTVLKKYGVSIKQLMGTAGPDKFLAKLKEGLTCEHGPVRLHFYPFGGVGKTVSWIGEYQNRNNQGSGANLDRSLAE